MSSSTDLAVRLAGVVAAQQEILAVVNDVDRIIQKLVERAPEITESAGAVIEMIEGSELVYIAGSGSAAQHVGLRLGLEGSISGTAVRTNEVIRCDDSDIDPRADASACRRIGIRSMVVVPLSEHGRIIGVLKTFSPKASAFDDLDAYVLQLLAGAASVALMQARSARERQLSEERYRMLFERNIAGVFRTSRDGAILDCNDAFVRYLGYDSRDELMKHQTWELYDQRADRERLLERLGEEESITNARIQLRRRDGTSFPGLVSVRMIPSADGEDQLLGILVEA